MKKDENCVRKVNGDIEAQQIKAFLAAHGIPCEFRGEALRMTHGLTLDGLGVVRICVPHSMVDEARTLLSRADAGEMKLPDHAEIDGGDE
ncbi:MAG: DUF2007 domain-containing protein [bacterium]|nr:DUF2007 domain-containing protein [bacterium]